MSALAPRVRCAGCGEVFPADAGPDEVVTCPSCGFAGKPGGVMRLSGFPSLESFERSWRRSRRAAREEAPE